LSVSSHSVAHRRAPCDLGLARSLSDGGYGRRQGPRQAATGVVGLPGKDNALSAQGPAALGERVLAHSLHGVRGVCSQARSVLVAQACDKPLLIPRLSGAAPSPAQRGVDVRPPKSEQVGLQAQMPGSEEHEAAAHRDSFPLAPRWADAAASAQALRSVESSSIA